jgi:hypothetical protein
MKKDILKHYPVGNGDTTGIFLKDGTSIQTDCHYRAAGEDENDDSKFDVKKDILYSIRNINNRYELDVFILSHADQDHCGGFRNNHYIGDPTKYGKSNYDNGEILIGELWITSRVFTTDQCDDALAIRNEANRRKRLHQDLDPKRFDHGNRLVIVGYDGSESLDGVEHVYPGETVKTFNGVEQTTFSLFIHSPFKKTLVQSKADKDRNSASIIFQARFLGKESNDAPICRLMMGGDADHYIWEEVLNKSKKHGNEDQLIWDILLAVHHCSWTFFNDVPYSASEENQIPKETSLDLLDYGQKGGYIIASSKEIIDDNDNPPHFPARNEYVKKVDTGNFVSLAVHPSKKKPEPVVFEIHENGYKKSDTSEDIQKKKEAAAKIAATGVGTGYYGGDERF